MTDWPTHIVAEPGDRHSLCGAKNPMPRVAAAHVQAHVDGYGMVVCTECAEAHVAAGLAESQEP